MMWWHDGWAWGWADWLGMALTMALFWGLLVFAVVMAVRMWRQPTAGPGEHRPPAPPEDPLRILDERLARGDIDPEDYRARREMLRSGG